MKARASTLAGLTAASLAFMCVLAGCSTSDSDPSSSSSAPLSSTTIGPSTPPPAAPADYSSLLITVDDIDSSEPFTAEPPILDPKGENGVTGRFFSEDGAMIGSTVRILADPTEAARVLELTRTGISNVSGTPKPSPIGTNGSVTAGMSLDQITGITVLTFSEQNAVVTLEFDGPYGKHVGLPEKLIDSVARRQLEILKAKLPEIAPPAPLTVALTVGGKPVPIRGTVVCKDMYGRSTIAAGNSDLRIVVDLERDASVVHDVYLGNIDDAEMRSAGTSGTSATATRNGNTYTINGTALGTTKADPPERITEPFEISVTCP